jgi:hypothetical protein
VGHSTFARGLLEFLHREPPLGFSQCGPDEGGDDDDRDSFWDAEPVTQGHEEIKLCNGH